MAVPVRRQFSRDPYWFDDYVLDPHLPPRRSQQPQSFEQEFGGELDPGSFDFDQDEFLLPPPPPPSWFRQAMLNHFHNRSSSFSNIRLGRLRRRGSIGGIGGPSEVYCGRGKMQVTLDVTHFTPEELNVKLVDNYLVIEGKHDEKQEGRGFISRHFVRRYEIPAGSSSSPDFEVKPEDVNCTLNSGGLLTVQVQIEPPLAEEEEKGKVIPITITSTSSSSSSKQYRHGHSSSSSVHVKATEDAGAGAAASSEEFVEGNNETQTPHKVIKLMVFAYDSNQ